jgi:hypothetical protein
MAVVNSSVSLTLTHEEDDYYTLWERIVGRLALARYMKTPRVKRKGKREKGEGRKGAPTRKNR